MIMGAYCVGKVDNMLPWWYYDDGSILCDWVHNMLPWQYQDNGSIVCYVRDAKCYLGSVLIMRAYCVGKIHSMLPW